MEVSLALLLVSFGFLSCRGTFSFNLISSQPSPDLCKVVLQLCRWHAVQQLSSIAISAEVGSKHMKHYFHDFSEEILRDLNEQKIQMDLFQYHHPQSWDFFNIILVDSADSFRKINPGGKTKRQDYSELYLIILRTLNTKDYHREMESIFAYCWEYYIINVSIILEANNGSVEVYTYFPFTESECFSPRPMLVRGRHFSDAFPNKLLDFHRCRLTAALWNVPPYLSLNRRAKGLDRFTGMEGHLLKELAEKMNFALGSVTPPNDQQRGLVFKNGSVTGALKMLQEKTAHLSLGCFRCTLERSSLLTASQSFYQTMQVYTVKAWTEPWTTFDIITYPFDAYVWTFMMAILFTLILLSIWLGNRHHKALRFIFGFRDTNSSINIISAWLGSPVVPEPKRTFARFMLTLWLLSTLILRNSYQGLLFTFLHSNLAKQPPDTSLELAQRGYSLIVNLASNDTFSGVPVIRDGHLNVLVKNITDAGGYPLLEATDDHLATATPKDFLSYYVMTTKKYGVFHVLKETIFSQQICIYFTKHSFLVDRFNAVLMNLRSCGLIDLWASQYIDDRYIEAKAQRPAEELPITMHQLEGVFQILLICLATAAVVFLGELLFARFFSLRN